MKVLLLLQPKTTYSISSAISVNCVWILGDYIHLSELDFIAAPGADHGRLQPKHPSVKCGIVPFIWMPPFTLTIFCKICIGVVFVLLALANLWKSMLHFWCKLQIFIYNIIYNITLSQRWVWGSLDLTQMQRTEQTAADLTKWRYGNKTSES